SSMRVALCLVGLLVARAASGCSNGSTATNDGSPATSDGSPASIDAPPGVVYDGRPGADSNGGGGDDASIPGCLEARTDHRAASTLPPNKLDPKKVPQFVMFGFDDDAYAEGMNWVVNELFAGRKNADGSPARVTFFIIGGAASDDGIFTNFG